MSEASGAFVSTTGELQRQGSDDRRRNSDWIFGDQEEAQQEKAGGGCVRQ
ncbi:hypothetical protein ACFQ3P_30180 [Paraburkholderia sabiae]|uniref:Uncharacterized protein n=1 Tax=Paraburkholderia sabiae TaxID=273251 RepID=A0ABU9QNA8_9BURK|nr:hypothetical protein [Paraburkholderia sabiae]WJZ74905.1 hypothetical protein QEN71_03560 [Paraburkholderia sabiae]